jgi:hypothetical protein
MIFTSIPDNYAPITAPLLYHFDLEEERQVVDVKIIDATRSETLAIKRLYNRQSAVVDIQPYIARCLDYRSVGNEALLSVAEGLFAKIIVEVDGASSDERIFSPYRVESGCGTLFQPTLKSQNLSQGESDYIIVYAPNGGSAFIDSYAGEEVIDTISMAIEAMPELQILKIAPSQISADVDSILVEVDIEGVFYYQSYHIVPKIEGSTRLIWAAEDGSLQLYTFPICRTRRSLVEKHRTEGREGVRTTHSRAQVVRTLISDYGTASEMESLGEILASKFVWIDKDGRCEMVDVLSTESVVRYGGVLNSLQVEVQMSRGGGAAL